MLSIQHTRELAQELELLVLSMGADEELGIATTGADLGFREVDLTPWTATTEDRARVEGWWVEEGIWGAGGEIAGDAGGTGRLCG